MAIKTPDEVPEEIRDKVSELIGRLRTEKTKELMRSHALTRSERQWVEKKMSKDEWDTTSAIQLFAKIRCIADIVAALDLGVCCGYLDPYEYNALRSALGIDVLRCDADVQRAMLEADLVLDESRRLVIWKRREVPGNFDDDDVLWNYIWKLGFAGSSGRSIYPADFSPVTQATHLTQWKYRLTRTPGFPSALKDAIRSKEGRHSLQLPSKKIRVFPNPKFAPLA